MIRWLSDSANLMRWQKYGGFADEENQYDNACVANFIAWQE
jgi:hypothetical protein